MSPPHLAPAPRSARIDVIPKVACWLCARAIAVRRSRDGHCYVVCLDCGMQAFIRSAAGERRLMTLRKPEAGENPDDFDI